LPPPAIRDGLIGAVPSGIPARRERALPTVAGQRRTSTGLPPFGNAPSEHARGSGVKDPPGRAYGSPVDLPPDDARGPVAVRRDLDRHRAEFGATGISAVFAAEPDRVARMTLEAAGLSADFSKHLVTAETLRLLGRLAEASGVAAWRDAMFGGASVNRSENRPALHTALRLPAGSRLVIDGIDVVAEVHSVLDRMGAFAADVRAGEWRGADGRPIRTVVNLGIGGSDLGPRMAVRALRRFGAGGPEVRFVANVDGADLERTLSGLDPGETLFVVCSKTFRTTETLVNARAAREWITHALGIDAISRHFVAASADLAAAAGFGVDPERVFGFAEWVGGRYSLPSAIGLSLMLAIGPDAFAELLAGFHDMDRHFAAMPFARNIPMLHGLLAVWYSGWFGAASTAVVPYSADLDRFPAYLQQLTMESNGKQVRQDGSPVADATAAVTWGEAGTDAQHSFFQLLHQGTRFVPVDLIGILRPSHDLDGHHDLLLANLIAQSRALAFGRSEADLRGTGSDPATVPHRVVPGDHPNTVILAEELSPRILGALVALYEHSVFTQAVVWGIDPFDQWGVELGKEIADVVASRIAGATGAALDPSTESLVERVRSARR